MQKLRKMLLVVAGMVIIVCGSLTPALGQTRGPRAGLKPSLPLVPEFPTRPGETPAKPWRDKLTAEEQEPSSSFIDSIKVNDAAIEVVLGQGRLITLAAPLANEDGVPVIAIANPSIVDFEILPKQRMLRLVAKAIGVTDLSFISADGESHSFEIHVTYDTVLLKAQLRQIFPTAMLNLKQLREHLIVEGQARSPEQVQQILTTIEAYLSSIQLNETPTSRSGVQQDQVVGVGQEEVPPQGGNDIQENPRVAFEPGERAQTSSSLTRPQLINLIRVPGSQQVMLKVTVAELNRTGPARDGSESEIGKLLRKHGDREWQHNNCIRR